MINMINKSMQKLGMVVSFIFILGKGMTNMISKSMHEN